MRVDSGDGLVTQSCPTLCNPMDCSLPGSSVHEIPQVRILGWVTISFSSEWIQELNLKTARLEERKKGSENERKREEGKNKEKKGKKEREKEIKGKRERGRERRRSKR